MKFLEAPMLDTITSDPKLSIWDGTAFLFGSDTGPNDPWRLTADDIDFLNSHRMTAIRTRIRQLLVAVEFEAPPATATIEGFPALPLRKAAEHLMLIEPEHVIEHLEAGTQEYFHQLFIQWQAGDKLSGDILSSWAMGGHILARSLVNQMDNSNK